MMTPPNSAELKPAKEQRDFLTRVRLSGLRKIIRRSLNFKIIPSGTPPEFELLKFPPPPLPHRAKILFKCHTQVLELMGNLL